MLITRQTKRVLKKVENKCRNKMLLITQSNYHSLTNSVLESMASMSS